MGFSLRWIGAPAALATVLVCAGFAAAQDDSHVVIDAPTRADTIFGAYMAAGHAETVSDFGRAADLLDRILAVEPENPLVQRRAMLANLHAGRVDRAVDLARPQASVYPREVDIAALAVAAGAMVRNDWDRAVTALEPARRVALARFASPIMSAWAELGRGDVGAAIESLSPLRDGGEMPLLHDYHVGLIFLSAGQPEEAEAVLTPYADDLESATLGTVRTLARARLAQGDAAGAEDLLRRYQALVPGFPMLTRDLEALTANGALPPVASGPQAAAAGALIDLARQVRTRAPLIALRYARLGVFMDQESDLGRMVIAAILEALNREADAIDALRAVRPGSDFEWDARVEIGDNLIRLERDEEAVSHFEAMATERPDDIDALDRLGYLMRLRERYAEGTGYYNRALDRVPEIDEAHWTLFYHRGITLERTKRWDEAEADFRKALDLRPDDPYVLNYLGYSWVDQGVNIDEALDMIEKAVGQRPNDGYIVDSLGWAYYRLDDFEEAVIHLERAVQLRPQDPVINDHLGDAYWQVGRTLEARFQWTRALSLDPEEAERVKIEEKLSNGMTDSDG